MKFDELPKHEIIDNYLFAGRSSLFWIPLEDVEQNKIQNLIDKINQSQNPTFNNPIEPKLDDFFSIVHTFKKTESKLFLTLGIGNFKDNLYIEDYKLGKQYSQYFCYCVFRNSRPTLEIRANNSLVPKIIDTLNRELSLNLQFTNLPKKVTLEEFLTFKSLIPTATLRKYKGRSVDDNSITEIFEYTARQNVDYATEEEFLNMVIDKEDEAVSFSFEYDGFVYTAKVGLLTRSIFFQSYVSEEAIDYIFGIYRQSLLLEK